MNRTEPRCDIFISQNFRLIVDGWMHTALALLTLVRCLVPTAEAHDGVTVSTGASHTCGIKTDGTLACWGANAYGDASPPTGIFTQVSAGYDHTCGIKADGTLACWGNNTFGQATPPSGTFMQISAGDSHTCGVKTDGTLACWGSNRLGESTPPRGTFTQVSTLTFDNCGLKTDGSLDCWGTSKFLGIATPPSGPFKLPPGQRERK